MSTAASNDGHLDPAPRLDRRRPAGSRMARPARELSVFVASDHVILGDALQQALTDAGHRAVTSRLHAVDRHPMIDGEQPDVALVDVIEPGGAFAPVVRNLRAGGIAVVALVESSNERMVAECLEAGAEYICDSGTSLTELLDVVRSASLGVDRFPASTRVRLLGWLVNQRASERAELEPFRRLTSQERQVLALLIEGDSPSEIAAKRVVSIATVRSQIRAVLGKLQVRSQLAAAALARQVGWEPDDDVIDLRDGAPERATVSPEPRIAG